MIWNKLIDLFPWILGIVAASWAIATTRKATLNEQKAKQRKNKIDELLSRIQTTEAQRLRSEASAKYSQEKSERVLEILKIVDIGSLDSAALDLLASDPEQFAIKYINSK